MIYRIACCSDTHETAPAQSAIADILCWLHAGDYYNYKDVASADDSDPELATMYGELEGGDAFRWVRIASIPIYTVRGNHDGHDAWGFYQRANNITGKVVQIAPDLLVAGIGWHGRHYYDLPTEEDLTEVCQKIRQAYAKVGVGSEHSPRSVILLTHYPAFTPNPSDKQESLRTYTCLRELAAILKPDAIIQGHVHEWAGRVSTVSINGHNTLVVNPGPSGGILTVSDGIPAWF